ncbi:MAG: tryptophan--tRNA ligase [Campylobacterales bacterium]|nr:tryptophan--tRNA ligase [Campylobacterales bacterium]
MLYLSGIQPSGKIHIGNYFGMIKKMVDSQNDHQSLAFIANYHAMTSVRDGAKLKEMTREAAINFLSVGLDPEKTTFWVQSDVKEVLELYWILSGFTPMGLLNQGHSYKDKTAKGIAANHSLFSYPVLMAADILLFGSEVVPVGKDQIQHVEMARDIAIKFNNEYGEILTIPEYKIDEDVATVPGIDGAKMSKSYNNTIDMFGTEKELEKQCKKIVTDSTPMEEPKEYENCNIYKISKLFLNEDELKDLQVRYKSGKEGYGHFKLYLKDVIWNYFAPFREKREYYMNNPKVVNEILASGADKARNLANERFSLIKEKVGI